MIIKRDKTQKRGQCPTPSSPSVNLNLAPHFISSSDCQIR